MSRAARGWSQVVWILAFLPLLEALPPALAAQMPLRDGRAANRDPYLFAAAEDFGIDPEEVTFTKDIVPVHDPRARRLRPQGARVDRQDPWNTRTTHCDSDIIFQFGRGKIDNDGNLTACADHGTMDRGGDVDQGTAAPAQCAPCVPRAAARRADTVEANCAWCIQALHGRVSWRLMRAGPIDASSNVR